MSVHIEDHSREAIEAKNESILRFLTEAGLHLEGEAKEELGNDPQRIDTGLLRNSIAFAIAGDGASINSYKADRPKSGKSEVETGSYSGTTPEEPQGNAAVYVGTNVEYGIYVHEGTQNMPANRFLKNAFERNAGQLKSKLREALMGK